MTNRFRFAFRVILVLLGAWSVGHTAQARDLADYCVPEAANVVVYVDVTTPYDDIDKAALVDGVDRLFTSLEGGERLSIRTIAESFTSSKSLLDACAPHCDTSGFLAELFGDCTEGVLINDRKHLQGAVVSRLKELLDNFVELPNSEIVRTVAMSSKMEYRDGRPNQLFIFSDLIENSLYLSGKEFFSLKNEALLLRIAADGLIPDLTGATVRIFGVGRGGNPGDRHPLDQQLLEKLYDFWEGYFAAAEATVTIQQELGAI
jgi:hypothetical protein